MNPNTDPTPQPAVPSQPEPVAPQPAPPAGSVPAAQQPISQLTKPQPLSVQPPASPQPTPPSSPAPTSQTPPTAEAASTDSGGDSDEPTEKPLWRRVLGFLVSWVVVPAILVYFVHTFVFQAWYVDGSSMEPTLENGNYLIVSKFDASWKKMTGQADKLDIQRGDVVIFTPVGMARDVFYIKRAIGLPGEKVVVRNGQVRVINDANPNGFVLNEPYVGNIALEGDGEWTVPADSVFVLGDNRNPGASQDSRFLGPIPKRQMVGIASLRLLPVNEFGSINHVDYNAATTGPSSTSSSTSPK